MPWFGTLICITEDGATTGEIHTDGVETPVEVLRALEDDLTVYAEGGIGAFELTLEEG